MLCHFAGYSCSYVNGFVYDDTGKLLGNHAWNVALFGNRYVWFDAAWDDAGPAFRNQWFALGGKEMHRHRKLAPGYQCIPWNT